MPSATKRELVQSETHAQSGQLPQLPKGFFHDKATEERSVGKSLESDAAVPERAAALEQLHRDVDYLEKQHAEAEAATAEETAARQLALEQFELSCVPHSLFASLGSCILWSQ